jgi:hypothetical protein
MNNILEKIKDKKSGIYLLSGNKKDVNECTEIIILNYKKGNIVKITLNKNNYIKKEDFEPIWNHISMNWNDDPQIIIIENIDIITHSVLQTLIMHLDKEYKAIIFIFTTESYKLVNPSIKTRAIQFLFKKQEISEDCKKVINFLTSPEIDSSEIEKFIDNLEVSINESIEVAEKIMLILAKKNKFENIKRIKSIISTGILPEMQKNFLKIVYTIFNCN